MVEGTPTHTSSAKAPHGLQPPRGFGVVPLPHSEGSRVGNGSISGGGTPVNPACMGRAYATEATLVTSTPGGGGGASGLRQPEGITPQLKAYP